MQRWKRKDRIPLDKMQDIKGLYLEELENILGAWEEPPFRAKQIFAWIYKKGAGDFQEMSDLSAQLRKRLEEKLYLFSLKLIKALRSSDGTEKLLFMLQDGNFIEAVSIPTEKRLTGCISTQAGCRFRCFFCASGKGGLKRNLTAAEIIEQAVHIKNKSNKLTHLVFMGTGEPLDNYDNVIKAIRIINSKAGLYIGARRITISTCGIIPGIKRLADEGLQVELSVSLHAADDNTRTKIMPINKIYPLKDLINACKAYIKKTGRQITFEYILLKGINSDLKNALILSKILKGLNCKVNIIPVNPVRNTEALGEENKISNGANPIKECKTEPPIEAEILSFRDYLLECGINATLRRPRGQDIEAACGQLRLRYEKK
jgi:23S rRNA (adenine2503-C2)-methyltransferase